MKDKVGIIGGGPAGIAAAIQLKRFDVPTLLFDAKLPGSLLKNAHWVENYLGFYPGLSGNELLEKFHANLSEYQIEPIYTKVKNLDYKDEIFILEAGDKTYHFDYVIVASGTKPKIGEHEALTEVFPLLAGRNKTILIIGGGDAAFDNALNLAEHNQVIICNRSNKFTALPVLLAKALKHKNIQAYQSCKLQTISSNIDNKQFNVSLVRKNETINCVVDHVLQAIGRVPQKDFYSEDLKKYEKLLIRRGQLFLAGDVKNARYRQVAIAVGDGIMAAMKISHKLQKSDARRYQ